jgi:HAD-superfamily hydrolase, subfamily IIB
MKQKSSKIIFFDIDGTLIDTTGIISDKLMQALHKLKENGHEICLATGRSADGQIEELRKINWDGYVLGNGVYGEYKGKVVIHETIPTKDVKAFVTFTKEIPEMGIILEGNTGSYATKLGSQVAFEAMKKVAYYGKLSYEEFIDYFQVVDDLQTVESVNKMMYFNGGKYVKKMTEKFGKDLSFIPNSVTQSASLDDGEIMKMGISKAVGIQRVIEQAGYEQKDVIAFGDGYNDLEMIEFAGIGVAMGNAVEPLKEKADLITASIHKEGIVKALETLKLI